MKAADILKELTLEEKCALLAGATAFGTRRIEHAGLPALIFSDGPHGVRKQPDGANHLGLGTSLPATCFPTAVTLADTWDPDLVAEVGAALGEEAASQGVNVLLGPGICIKRNPLGGRGFEYYSEDPFLAGELGAAYVEGVQTAGIGACVKHFAVNSQETRRQASDSVLDERTLREIYLSAFETVVRHAQPACVMTSYNKVNGVYANESRHLLQDILYGEWGYTGAVVTDWGGSNDHVAGVAAGSTFEMPSPGLDSTRELLRAVRSGAISEELLDERVATAIELVLSTHDAAADAPAFDGRAHHETAKKAAAAGIVLLKNGDGARKPPLPLVGTERVALIGDFAAAPRYQGAGSSFVNPTRLDTLLDCVEASSLELVGYEQGFDRAGERRPDLAEAAVRLAKQADVVLVCLGLPEAAESESMDRTSFDLPDVQTELVAQLAKANPNIVALLSAGGPVACQWAKEACALLYLGLGGQAGADAALDVLLGACEPAGRLAETWPLALEDVPSFGFFPSDDDEAQYREGLYVGYRYYATRGQRVAYPFGYGLSYTDFALSGLSIEADETGALPTASVSFEIENTGTRRGAAVPQVYIAKQDGQVFRPARELKGFRKVWLDPGERRRVTIELDERAFRYFDIRTGTWEAEGGRYEVQIGTSCDDIVLEGMLVLSGTAAGDPYEGRAIPSYRTGDVQGAADDEFAALLGRPLRDEPIALDRNLCFRDLWRGRSPLLWLVWFVLDRLVERGERRDCPNLNVLFVYNMPLRALSKNAGRFVSMGFVDALVREAKGWGLAGAVPALAVQLAFGHGFFLVWLAWAVLPLAWEFALNRFRNWRGERLLARQDRERGGRL